MLKVNKLFKSYTTGKMNYPVLKNVNMNVEKGEFVAVMGPSGSGKTTLLNCISCFIPYDSGDILLDRTRLADLDESRLAEVRNRQLGFVFQDFMLLDGLSVLENICLPQIIRNQPSKEMENKANKLAEMFGIKEIGHKYPVEISGGQKQRAAVARALMNDPLLILADEPTGNLDSKSGRAVIDAFLEAKSKLKATIFMVTHDSFAASFCDRVIVMKDGTVFKELRNHGARIGFMDQLLAVLKELGGADGNS